MHRGERPVVSKIQVCPAADELKDQIAAAGYFGGYCQRSLYSKERMGCYRDLLLEINVTRLYEEDNSRLLSGGLKVHKWRRGKSSKEEIEKSLCSR